MIKLTDTNIINVAWQDFEKNALRVRGNHAEWRAWVQSKHKGEYGQALGREYIEFADEKDATLFLLKYS